ncbi:alpha/beta fold hydrolase [Hymenobacter seoulensis]
MFLLLPLSSFAQLLPLQGMVLDQHTSAPVPFASVGIAGKPLGTVADESGLFRFSIPDGEQGNVMISCVGYHILAVPVATLQQPGYIARLVPSGVSLGAVTVRPGTIKTQTFGRTASSTLMGANLYTEANLISDDLAKEQGTILPLADDCRLRDFNFHVAFNRFKRVKFRLNLYSVKDGRPDQQLLQQDIRFDVTVPRGWVKVDLMPYQVQLQGHKQVAVTLQWLQSEAVEGQHKAFAVSAVPLPGHSILSRTKSQAEWQETAPGYLSFYLTADTYRGQKSTSSVSVAAPDYVLPDSLRYLRYMAATSLPELTNPQHFGDNPQAGGYVPVRGAKLYYERYGHGEPLLLLHGNGQSIAAFQLQIADLARHFEVIAVDTRAQGKSLDFTTTDFTYDLFAEDIRQLLDTLQLRRVHVLGWSDGGNTALKLALQHPTYVNRIAIMGANLFPTSAAIEPDFLKLLRQQLQQEQTALSAQNLNRVRLLKLLLQEPQMTFQELGAVVAPTLVLAGEQDLIVEAHTRAIAQALPQSHLVIFKGATHYAPQEIPAAFNKEVLRFFTQRKRLPSSGAVPSGVTPAPASPRRG